MYLTALYAYANSLTSQTRLQQTYGRNRQSIADLEQELYDMFVEHPKATLNESQEPVIPGDALVDIFRAFSRHHDSVELLTKEEEDQLKTLIESNPGLAVTPQVLLQFIAVKSTLSPKHSPEHSPPATFSDLQERGRDDQHVPYRSHSRSSSRSSGGTSVYRPPSRPPSRGPPVPKTPTVGDSPFDRRMRSTPLQNAAAPSSWTRRPPPSRRKSDAGAPGRALSDTEVRVNLLSSPFA